MADQQSREQVPADLERYSRQIRFPKIGLAGQKRLQNSTALVVGCGALGSVIAETLVRSGVGNLWIVDRDFVELHNLQRQVLYDESDVRANLPKAVAAANKLKKINSAIEIRSVVQDVDYRNIEQLAKGVDVIVDGTDNFEIRFLLNDVSLQHSIPWIYGGCIGSEGQSMTIVPGTTNCLHCLMNDGPPPPGTTPGCDVAGVVAPIVNVIASIQAIEAIKILSGNIESISCHLTVVDLWRGRFSKIDLGDLASKTNCPICLQGQRPWLSGQKASRTAVLCGRNSVQIRADSDSTMIDLKDLETKLSPHGLVHCNSYLLKFHIDQYTITVFENGRAIIGGTDDLTKAKSLFTQWVGS